MSTFRIDDEIDKAVDRFSQQLREKLKKLVAKDAKYVLKQYIASQKETARMAKSSSNMPAFRRSSKAPSREKEYRYHSESENDYSD